MENTIQGKCPKCDHVLDIPADLERFSCMYCGARLIANDLVLPPAPVGDCGEALAYVKEHLMDTLTCYAGYEKKITKKDYAPSFSVYEAGICEIFKKLDAACNAEPTRRSEFLKQTVSDFLAGLQALIDACPGKQKKQRTLFDYKLIIALFLVPAVRHLRLSISEDFADDLHREWMKAYPDSPFRPGTYEQIVSGFRKRGFCFITTAVCSAEGKPDDCAELAAFRRFRDGYLSACPDGKDLIAEYYDIAPAIVAVIDYCCDAPAVYTHLRQTYLAQCYDALLAGKNEECKACYSDMVQTLKLRYLS